MPSRRKFRRNKRKTRRTKRGGVADPLPLPENVTYDAAVTSMTTKSEGDMYKINPDKVVDYYLNKALTQFDGLAPKLQQNYAEWKNKPENKEKNGSEYVISMVKEHGEKEGMGLNVSSAMALARAKLARKHICGQFMEDIFKDLMSELLIAYNSKSTSTYKITQVSSLKKTGFMGKGPPTFTVQVNNDGLIVNPPEKWEAQNTFFTAGDTSKMNSKERMAISTVAGKQMNRGYILGKIMGTIGYNISNELQKTIGINPKFGLDGMSGLRNCAILLYLCKFPSVVKEEEGVVVLNKEKGKEMIDLYFSDDKSKPLTVKKEPQFGISNDGITTTIKSDDLDKAIKNFKSLVRQEVTKKHDKYSVNLKYLNEVLGGLETAGKTDSIGVKLEKKNPIGGRKRRRRKRRTRRGGKSRRRKRTRRRRRR